MSRTEAEEKVNRIIGVLFCYPLLKKELVWYRREEAQNYEQMKEALIEVLCPNLAPTATSAAAK